MKIGHRIRGFRLAFCIFLALAAQSVHAYNFTPTEAEWATWPEYCRARYAVTSWVSSTRYVRRVPRSISNKWSDSLGVAFNPLHHYCAGLSYMQRYIGTVNEQEKQSLLRRALDEFNYTYARVPSSSYLYPEVAANFALAKHKNGETKQAEAMLLAAIEANPSYEGAYSALSVVFNDTNQPEKQMEILKQGNLATNGESAELQYFLGLCLAKNKKFEEAREHAVAAYKLGYPLSGLRNTLSKAGYELQIDDPQL